MRYDDQASRFDERAAVPERARQQIADALRDLVALRPGQRWLELGPGTGALSIFLIRERIDYLGLDRSSAMLDVFRDRVEREGLEADLRTADGNERWPVQDGSVEVIFSARAVHHLDVAHLVGEVVRVASPQGAWLVLGQATRPRQSVRAVMRRRMRRLLEERGYRGRGHPGHAETIFEALDRHGARRLAPRVAAAWTHMRSPGDSLGDWEGKEGLAGLEVPADVKSSVLDELRVWAEQHYGDLEKPLEQEESFELSGTFVKVEA